MVFGVVVVLVAVVVLLRRRLLDLEQANEKSGNETASGSSTCMSDNGDKTPVEIADNTNYLSD